ncbi:hypothetical protein C8R45DRAFT_1104462 [Mycena sanguinolenta]|nr:hypothetical protein C8R45DRAFT_1104462 [Mycena sanguinolenta]
MLTSVLAYVSSFVVLASLIVPVVPRRTTNFTHLPVPPLIDFDPRPSTGHGCTTSHFQSITAFGVLSLVFVLSARALKHALGIGAKRTNENRIREHDGNNKFLLQVLHLFLHGSDLHACLRQPRPPH